MPPSGAPSVASQVAEALCRRDFDAVVARFDPRMEQGLPRARLEADVGRELSSLGAFVSLSGAETIPRGDYVTEVVTCVFERGSAAVQISTDARGKVVELFVRAGPPGADTGSGPSFEDRSPPHARSSSHAGVSVAGGMLISTGLLVALGLIQTRVWDARFFIGAFVIGTMGWVLASALRFPVSLGVARRGEERAVIRMAVAVGFLEQPLLLAAIATAGRSFARAYSIGLGFAGIETLFVFATAVGIARAGRAPGGHGLAPPGGSLDPPGSLAPPGVGVRRLFGELVVMIPFNVGAALLLARYPLMLAALIPLRSAVATAEAWLRAPAFRWLIVSAVAAAVFGAGLAVSPL